MPDFQKLAKIWHNFTYPRRPGDNFLTVLEEFIHEKKKICILGSTPEFRLLAKRYNSIVDIYDESEEMLQSFEVGNKYENKIRKNWFDINRGSYDLILGDLIFGLIEKSQHRDLLKIIHNNLEENGLFIFREVQLITQKETLEQYLKEKLIKENFSKKNWNEISFNCTLGLSLDKNGIYESVKGVSVNAADDFLRNYSGICPYGNLQYNFLEGIKNIKRNNYIMKHRFNFVEEGVICLSKNNLKLFIESLNI